MPRQPSSLHFPVQVVSVSLQLLLHMTLSVEVEADAEVVEPELEVLPELEPLAPA